MIWFVFLVEMCIGVDFLLIKQIPRGRNVFCKVWVNVIILFHSGILPPNSGEDQKKRSLPHSDSISVRNFGFPVAKWVFLAKKLRGPDIFCPLQCKIQGGAAPHSPQNRRLWRCVFGILKTSSTVINKCPWVSFLPASF